MFKISPHIKTPHGFFSRAGGVSEGIYTSLNCGPGSGDHPEAVMENRARAARALEQAPQNLVTLYQIHSTKVIYVEEPWVWERGKNPQADAMVTNKSNIALSVLSADCTPVLFADENNKV